MAAIVVVPVSGSVVKNENGPVNCQCSQITKDDTNVDDELENISADGVMNNIIFNGKSDKDGNACFTIHHRMVPRTAPFIAFSATDGCFGYIPSPMEFEYYILDCLMNA